MREQLAAMFIFIPLIADTLWTVIRRTQAGCDPMVPHFDFNYQRMYLEGWTKRCIVLLHLLAAVLWGTLGLLLS